MALPYLAAAFDLAPFVRAWHYDPVTGAFGAAISPGVNPGSAGRGVCFHPDRDYVLVAHDSAPFGTIYNFDKAAGSFGAKLADPATPVPGTQALKCDWHPDGRYLALAHRLPSAFSVYAFDPDAGAWGARSVDPADTPTQLAQYVHWHPSGNWIMVAHFNSPRVSIYPFNATTGVIGARLANPAVLPGSNANSARFSPDGNWIVVTWGDTIAPELGVWAFNQGGGGSWGAKASGPADVATNDSHNTAEFNVALDRIIVGQNINIGGPRAYAYEFTTAAGGTVGARRTAAAPQPADNVYELKFDRNERFVAVGFLSVNPAGSTGLRIWNWDGSDYGVALADPPGVPASAGAAVDVLGVGWSELPPAPTVVSVTPATGEAGDSVTIAGTGFVAGAAVTFDGVAATGVVVDSAIQITATVPAGSGTVAVTVTNPDGQSGTLAAAFTYVVPVPAHPTPLGGGPQPLQSTEKEAVRVLATARGFGPPHYTQALEVSLQQLLDEIRGFAVGPPIPTDADRLFDLIFEALAVERPRYATRNALLALIEANLPG